MKVAHICTTALSHKVLVDKLSLMRTLGYDIHLVSSEEGYDPRVLERSGLTVRFVPMVRSIRPFADLRAIYRLYKLLGREGYDIVHTHTAKAGVLGRIAAWLSRTPVIIHTTHGLPFYEGQGRLKNAIYRSLEKAGSVFCHAIASQNREDMGKLRRLAPRVPVYYEGNGVDLQALDDRRSRISPEELEGIRAAWAIPQAAPVLLVAARFEPVKNHFLLLDGLRELKRRYTSDFVCLLAGRGELEEALRARVAEYGLADQIRFVGHQTDVYPYLELADAVVLSSEKEGIPRIVMEAMTYGKPVVATDVMGTRELVTHGETGLLVPDRDSAALADGLHRILSDPELAASLGGKGRKLIEREFTEEKVIRRIHEYYAELLPSAETQRARATT